MRQPKTELEEYQWQCFYKGKIETLPDSLYRNMQWIMFLSIWNERPHKCEITDKLLHFDPRSYYFHHILEKRNYELYALCKWNIIILDYEIHNRYELKPDTEPQLQDLKQSLINKIEDNEFRFDNDIAWRTGTAGCNLHTMLGSTI